LDGERESETAEGDASLNISKSVFETYLRSQTYNGAPFPKEKIDELWSQLHQACLFCHQLPKYFGVFEPTIELMSQLGVFDGKLQKPMFHFLCKDCRSLPDLGDRVENAYREYFEKLN
jgi:hypothetical protein